MYWVIKPGSIFIATLIWFCNPSTRIKIKQKIYQEQINQKTPTKTTIKQNHWHFTCTIEIVQLSSLQYILLEDSKGWKTMIILIIILKGSNISMLPFKDIYNPPEILNEGNWFGILEYHENGTHFVSITPTAKKTLDWQAFSTSTWTNSDAMERITF